MFLRRVADSLARSVAQENSSTGKVSTSECEDIVGVRRTIVVNIKVFEG